MNKKSILIFITSLILLNSLFARERPIVSNIIAIQGKGNKINISWKIPILPEPEVEMYFIYRSTKPMGTYYDVQNATLLGYVDSSTAGFVDTVKNYSDYYYAVIAQVNGEKYDIILPSINSTVNGVHLKLAEKKENLEASPSSQEKLIGPDELRNTPLPYLDFSRSTKKKPIPFGRLAKEAVHSLVGTKTSKGKTKLEPYVFEADLISPDGGDDYLLFDVLKNTFIQKKYNESASQLYSLLGTNISRGVLYRTTFYLGESLYFAKRYDEAVRIFLQVYDIYPSLSKKWIDASLDNLVIED